MTVDAHREAALGGDPGRLDHGAAEALASSAGNCRQDVQDGRRPHRGRANGLRGRRRDREKDARAAGYSSVAEAVADLRGAPGDPVYLLRIRLVTEPDPRDELARSSELDDAELAAIAARLARMDRSSRDGPWTEETLRIIASRPATRAQDLADALGRDRARFKTDVRRLKNLGLTISLETGYRLSPRGAAFLRDR